MTLNEYIEHPLGKGNTLNAGMRLLYTDIYKTKFANIMLRELSKIDTFAYFDKTAKYLHIKVPSEVVENLYYDVVFKFYITDKTSDIFDCEFQVFSNDPAFVYTYAHAFIKNKMFFTDLLSKMSEESIKNTATIKNPKDNTGYVKAIYFAYLYMKNRGLNKIITFGNAKPYIPQELLFRVMHADEKIRMRMDKTPDTGKDVRKKKIVDKMRSDIRNNTLKNKVVKTVSNVTGIKNTNSNKGGNVKKTKTIKPK